MILIYRLRKGAKNAFGGEAEEASKEDHNVYLFQYQWSQLDAVAEEAGKSRNQVVREILSDYFAGVKSSTGLKREITISVLEDLTADRDDLGKAVEAVSRALRGETQ